MMKGGFGKLKIKSEDFIDKINVWCIINYCANIFSA